MHPVDELLAEADSAIEDMRAASRKAARLHARAELMRHMRTTAAKVKDHPRDEAVAFVVQEWMAAWGLKDRAYPSLELEMRRFTMAFCADNQITAAIQALEAAFTAAGLDLADQMMWRSACAHRWWLLVNPAPESLITPASVPVLDVTREFWQTGCAAKCQDQTSSSTPSA